jgi:hypothetical protein
LTLRPDLRSRLVFEHDRPGRIPAEIRLLGDIIFLNRLIILSLHFFALLVELEYQRNQSTLISNESFNLKVRDQILPIHYHQIETVTLKAQKYKTLLGRKELSREESRQGVWED